MFRTKLNLFSLLALVCALGMVASSASATPLSFSGTQQDFSADLAATGTATVSATGTFTLRTSVPSIFGSSNVTLNGNVNIPAQVINLNLATGSVISTDPTGTATVTVPDELPGGTIAKDGGPSDGVLPSRLTGTTLDAMDVTFINSHNLSTNQANLNGNTSIDFFLGDINVATTVTGGLSGSLNNFNYTQDPGDGYLGAGTTTGDDVLDRSTQYVQIATGNYTGDLNAAITGNLSFSVFGINLGSFPISIPGINQSLNLVSQPFGGISLLQDLNPTGFVPGGDDMRANFDDGGLFGALPLDLDLVTVGSAPITVDTDVSFLGLDWDVDVNGSATFDLDATVSATNIAYHLEDDVADIVSPEPGSFLLAMLSLAAALPLARRRTRR